MKNIFKRKKIEDLDNSKESQESVYCFGLYHKPTKKAILNISDPYPSKDIAYWSAVNYYNWLLKDLYKEDDVIITLFNGLPEIIDNSNKPKPEPLDKPEPEPYSVESVCPSIY